MNKENFGQNFIEDHVDAYIDFFLAIKTNTELPKTRALIGLAQQLQNIIHKFLKVGLYNNETFTCLYPIQQLEDLCSRSPNDFLFFDNYQRSYTGKQLIQLIRECKIL